MARVTGVGGVFLRSADPKRLAGWYAEHLGLQISEYGGAELSWTDEVPTGTGKTIWSVFPAHSGYLGQPTQTVMINYRVDDLDALLEKLAAAKVWIDPSREDADYGRFAWIKDCDGNRVELWQPLSERQPCLHVQPVTS